MRLSKVLGLALIISSFIVVGISIRMTGNVIGAMLLSDFLGIFPLILFLAGMLTFFLSNLEKKILKTALVTTLMVSPVAKQFLPHKDYDASEKSKAAKKLEKKELWKETYLLGYHKYSPEFTSKGKDSLYLEGFKKLLDKKPVKEFEKIIDKKSVVEKTNSLFDVNLAYALAVKESSLNPKAKNKRTGATGLFQAIESTWDNLTSRPFSDATNPYLNSQVIFKNFKGIIWYMKKYNPYWSHLSKREKQKQLIAAHNWGQGKLKNVNFDISKAPLETKTGIKQVMGTYDYLNKKSSKLRSK